MILAAADYGEEKGDPPPELQLALNCKQWHALPYSGGLLDQPAGLVRRMTICLNVYNAFSGMTQARDKGKWTQENAQQADLVQSVLKMKDEVKHAPVDIANPAWSIADV